MDSAFELMELRNEILAAEIKLWASEMIDLELGSEPSQKTMVELGTEIYQKQPVENSRHLFVYLRFTDLPRSFRVIMELPSYLEKYLKTSWVFECAVELRRDF